MDKRRTSKNFVYEVEVSNQNHDEEFALELFEMMEDATQERSRKRIRSFDELLQWNEEIEEE